MFLEEDLTVLMKPLKGIDQVGKVRVREKRLSSCVTELEVCAKSANHLRRNVPLERRKYNLCRMMR
jgi:hypothetical protein